MERQQIHASAVEIGGRAALILGDSGAGKSSFALELMAMGANLIGDDQVFLDEVRDEVHVHPHPNANGRMEVRGVGVVKAHETASAKVVLVVNLNAAPSARLPEPSYFEFGLRKIHQYELKGLPHMVSFIYLLLTQKIEIEHS